MQTFTNALCIADTHKIFLMVNNGIHSICEIYLFSQFYAEIGDLKLKKYNNFVFGKLEKSKVQKSLNVKKKSTPRQ